MADNTKYKRPRVNPKRSLFEIVFNIISLLFLGFTVVMSVYILISYNSMIPSHFSYSGLPDSRADKLFIAVYLIIALLGYIAFYYIEKCPWVLRYSTEITEKNAEAVYKTRRSFDVLFKTEAMALIAYYVFGTDLISRGIITSMFPYFQFIAIGIIVITVVALVISLDKVYKRFEDKTEE